MARVNLRAAFSFYGVGGIGKARRLADDIAYRGGHHLADVGSILLATRTGDRESARRTLRHLHERTRASGGNTYWVPIVASWIDDLRPEEVDWPAIGWLDGDDATLRRWARVAG